MAMKTFSGEEEINIDNVIDELSRKKIETVKFIL